jgi:hypothetical protein
MKLEGSDGRVGDSHGDLGEEDGNLASARNGLQPEGPGVNQGVVGEDPKGALSL